MNSVAPTLPAESETVTPPPPDGAAGAAASGRRPAVHRILVFTIAGRTHCADIENVREIVPITATTRLPGAPRHVRGLINLRGSLVTVMDAALCLYGVPATDADASILLVERGDRVAGVIVDQVLDMQALPENETEETARLDLRAIVETALA